MTTNLDHLRALYAKATPGEWWVDPQEFDRHFNVLAGTHEADVGEVARAYGHGNAASIAALHNAFPALAAELEAARTLRSEAARTLNTLERMGMDWIGVMGETSTQERLRKALAAYDCATEEQGR